MLDLVDSLNHVTIFKSTYGLAILTLVNFTYHLVRIYLSKSRNSEDNEVSSYGYDKKDNGKYSKYSYTVSFLKELHLVLLDLAVIALTFLSNFSFLGNNFKVLIISAIPFMIDRFNQLIYQDKPFVESNVIQQKIKEGSTVKKIIYYLGYLIFPFAYLTLKGYDNSFYASIYLFIGIFFSLISRILNLFVKSNSNFSSESIWGSLIEIIGFSGIAGFYFLSNLLENSSSIILSGPFVPTYFTFVILFIIIIIYSLSNNKKN